jgi:glycosyltransferase involved in cell wall biosynthesis
MASLERALDRQRAPEAKIAAAAATRTPPPRPPRTVCVFVATLKREYSQTFVHDHLDHLPARTLLLHQEGRALLTKDDLKLLTPLERLAATILREFGNGTDAIRDRAVARFLRREGVDAVLVEFADQATSMLVGARAAGVPVIVHFHGFDAYRDTLLREKRDDYPLLFRSAAAVIAVSHAMERQLASIGAPPEKIRYSPCGTDVALFAGGDPAAAPPLFVAVGRFVDKKGPHLTLLAFRAVLDACPAARLVMIGDGPLLGACRTLAQQLGLGEAVTFRGAQPQAEGLRALRGARAFVQHSMVAGGDSEGTPVAVVEASACGVPVISTSHAGIPDVVLHGETGFVVAEGDVAAMATHMIALARDPLLAAQMGRRARARVVAEFSMERSIGRLWQAIDDAIRVGAGASG